MGYTRIDMSKIRRHEARVAAADRGYYSRLNRQVPVTTLPSPVLYKDFAAVAVVACAATLGWAYKKLRKKYG